MQDNKLLISQALGGSTREDLCPHCDVFLEQGEVKDEIKLGDEESVFARIPVMACPSCSFAVMDADAEEIRDAAVRLHRRLLTSAQIREIRDNLGFSRREFAEAFGIAPASMERWENGKLIQSESNDTLLRALANKGTACALDRRRIGLAAGANVTPIRTAVLSSDPQKFKEALARAERFSLRRL